MNTGEAIGILAKEKGFNLRQLAVKAEVPYNTLYAIVKRKSSRIDIKTLRRIANALEVSIDDIEPFTPKVMHLGSDESWVVGSQFDTVVTTRMLDADTRDARKAAKEDVVRLLKSFDLLDGEGQKKAIELIDLLTRVPDYRNPAAEKREPSREIAHQVLEEYADMRKANKEAVMYNLIEKLFAACDAGEEELKFAWVEELIVAHETGKTISEEKFLSLTNLIFDLTDAHTNGNEEEVHRLIAEFVDTAAYDSAEGTDKPQNAS